MSHNLPIELLKMKSR